ncbi:MAG TPA: hypothetical protein VF103_18190, partial [Polyangiaceae bacterium]
MMLGRWVPFVVLGGLGMACRPAPTPPPQQSARAQQGSKAAASSSTGAGRNDACLRRAERVKIGGIERSVPIVDPEHLENAARLNGCMVGIRAARLEAMRRCTLAMCPAAGTPSTSCCNRCDAGL